MFGINNSVLSKSLTQSGKDYGGLYILLILGKIL